MNMTTWKYKCRRCGKIYKIEENESSKTSEKTLWGLCVKHKRTTHKKHCKKKIKSLNK